MTSTSPDDRAGMEISPFGLHWGALDEDISVPALLADEARVAAE